MIAGLRLSLLMLLAAAPAAPVVADTLVATRPIRANTVLTASDLALLPGRVAGALDAVDFAIGMEARANLYQGRPIYPADLGPPAAVTRNQIVTMIYQNAGLTIVTEGRALARAGPGEVIRVMNVDSRSIVMGQVDKSGKVMVNK